MVIPTEDNQFVMQYRKLHCYKYQLIKQFMIKTNIYNFDINTEFVKLNSVGYLTLEKYYACDGPSGPTIDTRTFMRGAFVHDALYQLIRLSLLPKEYKHIADCLLYDICIEDRMNRFRAWYVYQAVRFAGFFALSPNKHDTQIITIP
jgi:hypothetical protein